MGHCQDNVNSDSASRDGAIAGLLVRLRKPRPTTDETARLQKQANGEIDRLVAEARGTIDWTPARKTRHELKIQRAKRRLYEIAAASQPDPKAVAELYTLLENIPDKLLGSRYRGEHKQWLLRQAGAQTILKEIDRLSRNNRRANEVYTYIYYQCKHAMFDREPEPGHLKCPTSGSQYKKYKREVAKGLHPDILCESDFHEITDDAGDVVPLLANQSKGYWTPRSTDPHTELFRACWHTILDQLGSRDRPIVDRLLDCRRSTVTTAQKSRLPGIYKQLEHYMENTECAMN